MRACVHACVYVQTYPTLRMYMYVCVYIILLLYSGLYLND